MITYQSIPLLTVMLLAGSVIARPAPDPRPAYGSISSKQTSRDEVLRRSIAHALHPHRRDTPSGTPYPTCSYSGTQIGSPDGAIFTNTGYVGTSGTSLSDNIDTTDAAVAQACLDYTGTQPCNVAWVISGTYAAIDNVQGITLRTQDTIDTFIPGMDCATASAYYNIATTCCNYYST